MKTPLLQTKLYISPLRSELVPRPRLIERLTEGLAHKLTLISAPAGFGKTTLVSDWLRQIDLPAAWLSLDAGDNDLTRFLTYFISAPHQIDSEIGQTMQGMLQSPQPPPFGYPRCPHLSAQPPPTADASDHHQPLRSPPCPWPGCGGEGS